MKIYAVVIVDHDYGGEPEVEFFPSLEAAQREARAAYEHIVDSGGSIDMHWYDGEKQGHVSHKNCGMWDGPEVLKDGER